MPKTRPRVTNFGKQLEALMHQALLDGLLQSKWYLTAPECARQTAPSLSNFRLEERQMNVTQGMMHVDSYMASFVVADTQVGDFAATVRAQISLGGSTGSVMVDEVGYGSANSQSGLQTTFS